MPRTMTKRLVAAMIVIAVVASIFVGFSRIQVEQANNTISMAATQEDVASFAAAEDVDFQAMCREMKKRGLSDVFFKEISLGDLVRQGHVEMAYGHELNQLAIADFLPAVPVDDAHFYLIPYDDDSNRRLANHLTSKWAGVTRYDGNYTVYAVPSMMPVSADEAVSAKKNLLDTGLGFDEKAMAAADAAGLGQMVQLRTFSQVTKDSQQVVIDDLRAVPKLSLITFNDKVLPGYPDMKSLTYMFQDENGKLLAPLGSIEFNDQLGFHKLAVINDKNVLRLHTIGNEEMGKFQGESEAEQKIGEEEALDRWQLAAKERNIRVLLVRFFHIDEPAASFADNMAYLEDLQNRLLDQGFSIASHHDPLGQIPGGTALFLLVALGVFAGTFLMLRALQLSDRTALILTLILAAGYLVGYLVVDPILARKVLALVSVIAWPTFSAITFLDTRPQGLSAAILRLLAMSAVSFLGALFTVGLLSDHLFMLKLDYFSGVKIAHIIPLLLVPFALYLIREDGLATGLKNIGEKAVTYGWLMLAVVAGLALVIYVVRTGNTEMELSAAESSMRQLLTDVLGVRPRSKEFLIGYPLTLLYFYFAGKRPKYWLLSLGAVIGQVSLVNTYAHLHTPLLISLTRSGLGLLLGIIIGSLIILAIEVVAGMVAKHQRKGSVDVNE